MLRIQPGLLGNPSWFPDQWRHGRSGPGQPAGGAARDPPRTSTSQKVQEVTPVFSTFYIPCTLNPCYQRVHASGLAVEHALCYAPDCRFESEHLAYFFFAYILVGTSTYQVYLCTYRYVLGLWQYILFRNCMNQVCISTYQYVPCLCHYILCRYCMNPGCLSTYWYVPGLAQYIKSLWKSQWQALGLYVLTDASQGLYLYFQEMAWTSMYSVVIMTTQFHCRTYHAIVWYRYKPR